MHPDRQNQLRWCPSVELSKLEERICKAHQRTGRLFVFLRRHRMRILDEVIQEQLMAMYDELPRGLVPQQPAKLALVVILQAYEQASDAKAVLEATFDRRWQMVLDGLDAQEPPFSQGVLVEFRKRLIRHGMLQVLIDKTVQIAKETQDFGYKNLKVAIDSSPLWGAGRVEDTFNLIAHAMGLLVQITAKAMGQTVQQIQDAVPLTVLGEQSLKAQLDIDWTDEEQKQQALQKILEEANRLKSYVEAQLQAPAEDSEFQAALQLLNEVMEQDLEPEPDPNAPRRLRKGVKKDRRISISDPDMRHGRKSKSKPFNGYKRHLLIDLNSTLVLSGLARPANESEHHALELLRTPFHSYGSIESLHIDRGYLAAPLIADQYAANNNSVFCKPRRLHNRGRYTKDDFRLDLKGREIICPAQQKQPIPAHGRVRFDADVCNTCLRKPDCTKSDHGRSVTIHPLESLRQRSRELMQSNSGRQKLRERVGVEHSMGHLAQRQGPKARYRGTEKNTFDVLRHAIVMNLMTLDRFERKRESDRMNSAA